MQFSTVKETATLLRVSEPTVRTLCQQGKLPSRRVGKAWRVDLREVVGSRNVAHSETTT